MESQTGIAKWKQDRGCHRQPLKIHTYCCTVGILQMVQRVILPLGVPHYQLTVVLVLDAIVRDLSALDCLEHVSFIFLDTLSCLTTWNTSTAKPFVRHKMQTSSSYEHAEWMNHFITSTSICWTFIILVETLADIEHSGIYNICWTCFPKAHMMTKAELVLGHHCKRYINLPIRTGVLWTHLCAPHSWQTCPFNSAPCTTWALAPPKLHT